MKKQLFGLALAGAAIIAAIFSVAQSNVTWNATSTEILGIDILGLTQAAKEMPDHQYPTR